MPPDRTSDDAGYIRSIIGKTPTKQPLRYSLFYYVKPNVEETTRLSGIEGTNVMH